MEAGLAFYFLLALTNTTGRDRGRADGRWSWSWSCTTLMMQAGAGAIKSTEPLTHVQCTSERDRRPIERSNRVLAFNFVVHLRRNCRLHADGLGR